MQLYTINRSWTTDTHVEDYEGEEKLVNRCLSQETLAPANERDGGMKEGSESKQQKKEGREQENETAREGTREGNRQIKRKVGGSEHHWQ